MKSSLSFRILFAFLALTLVLTVLSTLVLIFREHQREMLRMENRLEQIGATYTDALSAVVWNMGDTETRLLLEGIHNIQDVVHLAVYDEKHRLLAEKGTAISTGLQRTFPLYQPEVLAPSTIGSLLVTMNMDAAKSRIRESALQIFTMRTLDLGIISLFFLWIIRNLVTRHLEAMASYTRQMNLDRLEMPLRLPGKKRSGRKDELDIVVDAINTMRLSILQGLDEKAKKARMEGELQAAASIQQALIPDHPPVMAGLDTAFFFDPALEVSGDYFDFFPLSTSRIGLVVADASGKGMPAALIAHAARILLHSCPELLDQPEALLSRLNRTLPEAMGQGHFLTLNYLLLDTETRCLTLVSAGHDPVLLRRHSGDIIRIKPEGYPFCRLHQKAFDIRLKNLTLSLESGDCLLLYTDGLSECLSPDNERFGEERIHAILASPHKTAKDLILHLLTEIRTFRGHARVHDDMTLVALRFVP